MPPQRLTQHLGLVALIIAGFQARALVSEGLRQCPDHLGHELIAIAHGLHPLVARLVSLAVATLVTWRLNRALTFDRSGRRTAEEAMRYAAVVIAAQTVSYGVFAILAVTLLAAPPQIALIAGAAMGALVSYSGQTLFAFRPRRPV